MPPLLNNVNEIPLTPIQKFYSGSNVFITGGSGFLGRLLVEKLLRSCPDVGNIYLLIREKKNKNINARIDEILDDCIFERLKSEYPKYRYKVYGIEGDCNLPNLGINEQDKRLLTTEVSIVFHAAATVNFDEKLKTATNINVQATRDVISLCKEMTQLKAVVHVSTAFSNCVEGTIEEVFYPAPMSPNQLTRLTEILDAPILDTITPSVLGRFPNTYTFTKAIAENVVQQDGKDLPIAVYRPSIIISTYKEPLQGWINNMYGPVGVAIGASTGIIRVLHCDPELNANVVPADMSVNALIAIPWEIDREFRETKNKNVPFSIPIYNYESSRDQPIDWTTYMKLIEKNGMQCPPLDAVWYYLLLLIKNYHLHQLTQFLLHYLPAILADTCLFVMRKKRRFIKIYRKIHRFTNVIAYFNTTVFTFKSTKIRDLIGKMSTRDQNIFFCDLKKLDWEEYAKSHYKGLRIYLLKDPLTTVPEAIRHMKRLYWCHQITKMIIGYILIRIAWVLLTYLFSKLL